MNIRISEMNETAPTEFQNIKRFLQRILLRDANYAEVFRLLQMGDMRPGIFLLPALLAILVAVFEAIGVWLMIPLVKGMMAMNFDSVFDTPRLKTVFAAFLGDSRTSTSTVFVLLVLMIFFVFTVKHVLQYASSVSVSFIVSRFANNLRKAILSNCLTYGKLYFDRVNAGYLHNATVNLTSTIAHRLADLQSVFACLFILIAYLGMMFYISWKLTLFFLIVFPILHVALARIIKKIRASSGSYAHLQSEMGRRVHNIFAGIPLVQAYSQERAESASFAEMSDAVEKSEFDIDRRLLLVQPVQEVIILAVLLLLISLMAYIVAHDGSSPMPGFLVFFYIIRRASSAFGALGGMQASVATLSGPVAEISGILNAGDANRVPDGSAMFPGLKSHIEFKGLSYSYDSGRQVLSEISFAVEKGKMTAIVGPSGAGKTTIAHLLCRFYDAPPGTILIDDHDIRTFSKDSIRSSIALVSQDPILFNDTLSANICYGLETRPPDAHVLEALRKARLSDLLSRLPAGLDTVIGDRGVQLSGGEKQRLAIARAILKDSPILILDEATSSLDSHTEKLIQEAVDDMIGEKTSIVIAHRLSTIKRADKVVVVEQGLIVECGSLNYLLKSNGFFCRYWETQKFF